MCIFLLLRNIFESDHVDDDGHGDYDQDRDEYRCKAHRFFNRGLEYFHALFRKLFDHQRLREAQKSQYSPACSFEIHVSVLSRSSSSCLVIRLDGQVLCAFGQDVRAVKYRAAQRQDIFLCFFETCVVYGTRCIFNDKSFESNLQ